MKKLALTLVLALFMGALAGCTTTQQSADTFTIGVLQMEAHPALDAAYQGFVDGLAEAGYKEGENVVFDFQNAQGKVSNCATLASKLVNSGSDLILAIATPAAQAVANATSEIPIVVTAVTDPVTAKLVESNEAPGTNVTGTSDLNPIRQQIELIKTLFPDAKKVGFMYSSSESNSTFQIAIAKQVAEEMGLETEEFSVSNTNDIQQVTTAMAAKVDVAYIPTDNMLAKAMPTVAAAALEAKLPVIVGEEGMVNSGGLASFSLNYYELGRQTAAMAVAIIEGKGSPAEMAIQYQEKSTFVYNEETAAQLGVEIPASLKDQA